MSVCAGHSMVRDISHCESCMWVAMQKWLSAGLEGKFTLCPPRLPAWMPLSCLWGKLVAALRREVQRTGDTGSALKALPAMGMGPGTLGCSQSAQNFCSYCNQDMKQIMLAGWWTLLATRAGGVCRRSGFGLSPGCLLGQVRWERAGFHSSGKCTGV